MQSIPSHCANTVHKHRHAVRSLPLYQYCIQTVFLIAWSPKFMPNIYLYSIIFRCIKRLPTPSDFHIPLPSTVPFDHSQASCTHRCLYLIFSRFFLSSCSQLFIIFGNPVRSILSTWPHKMSCFRVISSNILSRAPIFFSDLRIPFSV